MSALSASSDGHFLYAIGAWIKAGKQRTDLFRSSDLGTSWCVLTTPEQPVQLAPSPATPDRIYALASSDPSGPTRIMKTGDAGKTWSLLDPPSPSSGSLVPTVGDENGVWFVDDARDAVYVSRDAAKSWSPVPFPPEVAPAADPSTGPSVQVVVIDPASTEHALVRGFDPQFPGNERTFITDDAGDTWNEISSQVGPALWPTQVVFGAEASLYLMTNGAVSKSVDSGTSWSEVGPLPEAQGTFMSIGPPATDVLIAQGSTGTLWRSTDGAVTWQSVPPPAPDFSPDLVGVTGPDDVIGRVPGALTVSHDVGRSWKQRPFVPSVGSLIQSPVMPWPIWSTSPNLRSNDGGVTWSATSFTGSLVMDGASADVAFDIQLGGASMRWTEDGGRTWDAVTLPSGVVEIHGVASCPPPGSCLYVLYRREQDTGTAHPTRLARSDDRGRTWGAPVTVPGDPPDTALFYLPDAMVVSPDDSRHLFADGGLGLAETRDGGRTWSSQALPGVIEVLSIVAYEGGTLLVSSYNGCCIQGPDVVLRSTDGGANWTQVLQASGQLVVSQAMPSTVFLLANGVFRSDDGGATWSNVVPTALRDTVVPVAIADAPNGGFVLALDQYGFVHFD